MRRPIVIARRLSFAYLLVAFQGVSIAVVNNGRIEWARESE